MREDERRNDTMDIGGWLRGLGLERYEQAFRENRIEADVLPSLTVEDLRDLGVTLVGDRRRLLDAIAALDNKHTQEPQAEPSEGIDRSLAPTRGTAGTEAERRQLTVMFCDLVGARANQGNFRGFRRSGSNQAAIDGAA